MSRFCLDTSAYSRFRKGEAEVGAILDAAEWVGMPAITLGELRAGFAQGRRREDNESLLREFLSHPVVVELSVDSEVSRNYAEIVFDLRRAGTPLPANDIWIAAVAARHAALVLTHDAHFREIARVGCVVL